MQKGTISTISITSLAMFAFDNVIPFPVAGGTSAIAAAVTLAFSDAAPIRGMGLIDRISWKDPRVGSLVLF